MIDNPTAGAESLKSPPEEIELDCRYPGEEQSTTVPKSGFPSKFPIPVDAETESVVETMSFHDDISLMTFNPLAPQSDALLSRIDGENYIEESK